MMKNETEEPVLEPEWMKDEQAAGEGVPTSERLHAAFGPVVGGLIIDSLDLVTFGPIGILFGAFIGGSIAYYIASVERLPIWQRTLLATAAGFYCAFPFTNFIPAATMVGALIRYFQTGRRR